METPDLSPYAELADLVDQLPVLVRHTRRARGESMREAARKTGLSPSTFSRLESGGHGVDLAGLVALLRWMDDRPVSALRPDPDDDTESEGRDG